MRTITEKDLRNLVRILNEETGNPVEYIDKETRRCNPGHFHLDIAYGGYALSRTCSDSGGASNIIPRGTKRELYDRIQSFRDGIYYAKQNMNGDKA